MKHYLKSQNHQQSFPAAVVFHVLSGPALREKYFSEISPLVEFMTGRLPAAPRCIPAKRIRGLIGSQLPSGDIIKNIKKRVLTLEAFQTQYGDEDGLITLKQPWSLTSF